MEAEEANLVRVVVLDWGGVRLGERVWVAWGDHVHSNPKLGFANQLSADAR